MELANNRQRPGAPAGRFYATLSRHRCKIQKWTYAILTRPESDMHNEVQARQPDCSQFLFLLVGIGRACMIQLLKSAIVPGA
jgi:hypothetical protein